MQYLSQTARMMLLLITALCCQNSVLAENIIATAQSPDNDISVDFLLENEALFYRVYKQEVMVVDKSKLGINTSIGDFSAPLEYKSTSQTAFDESYTLPSGKKSTYTNKCNQTTLSFTRESETLEVIFRVYDDGIAFRYGIDGFGEISVNEEYSECVFPGIKRIFSQPSLRNPNITFKENSLDFLSCMNNTLALPLLAATENAHVLVSEAMVNGNYAGAGLFVDDFRGAFVYNVKHPVVTSLPFKSPWRTLIIGNLETIVASTLIENLNEPTSVTDFSWIKPGRALWNYGGEDTSDYLDLENIKTYIDMAQEMGYEYFTLDKGWENTNNFSLSQVVNYANSKSIGVFVWLNQNFLPDDEAQLSNTLTNLKSQGIKGLKVDFWESESQSTLKKYDLLLKLATEQELLLNFHSCAKPTGLRRTWPNLLTSGAVLGNIYYARNSGDITSTHNINSAIIRNALGATDFTPVDFAEKDGRILQGTTWAHQLALSIIYESGVQHIMDAPDNLKYNIARPFLETLPVAWDDTRCMEAVLNEHISIARKNSDDWYLATLTNEERSMELSLSFLSPDISYNAYVYKDGECPSEISFEYKEGLTSIDNLPLSLLSSGGAVIHFSPADTYAKPSFIKYEAESEQNDIPFGVPIKNDPDSLCSGGKFVTSIGKGRSITFENVTVPETGVYALTFYYMSDSYRSAFIQVNEDVDSWQKVDFINTGEESGSGLAHRTVLVKLEEGAENTIEFGNTTDNAPSLDRINLFLLKDEDVPNEDISIKEPVNDVKIHTDERQIIIEYGANADYSIYNSLGQLIQSGNFYGTTTIPVGNSGVYIVKLNSGSIHHSEKVVIK